MILLLQGSTDLARVALAEKVTKTRDRWRHLPIEGLYESEVFRSALPVDPTEELLIPLAVHLAKEMHNEKFHVLLSYKDATMFLTSMRDELGASLVSVFLHTDGSPPTGHDHIIPAQGKSVRDLYPMIEQIILSA